jgi:DNA-binding PadR family transcriptional regulator
MAKAPAGLLQGPLDLVILKALSAGELHGLAVSRRIEQITGGTCVVQHWRWPARSKRDGGQS